MPGPQDTRDHIPSQYTTLFLDFGKALDSELPLLFTEPPCGCRSWSVGEREESKDGHWNGNAEVQDEQPPPAGKTPNTVWRELALSTKMPLLMKDDNLTKTLMNAPLHKPGEHCSSQTTASKDRSSFAELVRLVPTSEDILATNERRSLKDSLKESDDHDLPWVVSKASTQSEQAPGNHARREIDTRRKLL